MPRRLLSLLFALSLLTLAPRALAQQLSEPEPTPASDADDSAGADESAADDPDEAAPAATAPVAETVVPEPPAPQPPAAPAPEGPLFQAVVAGVPIRLTGIVHAAVIGTQGVQSYGLPTAVAATSALNPALLASPDSAELTFQVQQTRLGMLVGEGTDFKGQVEIDFVHFDQSSPTTQAFPRIRIASLDWKFAPDQHLFLGQTWDLFGNATGSLLSHSFNLVGTLFQAGNIGFMRQQLGYSGRFGDVELAAAAGLQGANTGPSFANVEESCTPTGSARVMLHVGDASTIGASVLGTAIRFTNAGVEERRLAIGGNVFADLTIERMLNLHAEAYVAQNLANLGSLNLGQGRFGTDVRDAGGYVSAKLTLGQHSITAMGGVAFVLNPGDIVPGYAYRAATPGAMPTAVADTPAGPGMAYNTSAHVGYWYSPLRGLSIVVEPYVYATRFVLDAADVGRLNRDRVAFGVQLGSMFQF